MELEMVARWYCGAGFGLGEPDPDGGDPEFQRRKLQCIHVDTATDSMVIIITIIKEEHPGKDDMEP